MRPSEFTSLIYDLSDDYRLAKNFSRQLLKNFSTNLHQSQFQRIVSATRIPNERELYGLLATALHVTTSANDKPLLTEFAISRDEANGRVDFITFYRGTTFLIEFKVARIVNKGIPDDDKESSLSPVERVVKPWKDAVKQLKPDLNIQIGDVFGSPIVKLPLVLYIHVDYRGPDGALISSDAAEATKYVLEQLSECGISNEELPAFVHCDSFFKPFQTRRRRDKLNTENKCVNVYGFSLMVGCKALWN